MPNAVLAGAASRPAIYLSTEDHDLLSRLVGDTPANGAAGLLQQELDRAVICPDHDLPSGAVRLDRWVHYVDERSDVARRVKIVLPSRADIDAGLISVLSFVGAGLIGLQEGHGIVWTDPSGARRKLTPILVEDPEELV